MMRGFVWAGLVAVLGCGGGGGPSPGAWPEGEGWRLETVWQVGGADAEGPLAFGDVRALAVDGADRAWVLDAMAKHLVVLDTRGAMVRTVGRQGSGPGEFRDPYGMDISPAQEIWVTDPDNVRFLVFDTAGTVVGMYRRTPTCRTSQWGGRVLSDGRVLDVTCVDRDGERTYALAIYDRTIQDYLDTVPVPVAPSRRDAEPYYRFPGVTVAIPFVPYAMWHLTQRGTVWTGWGGQYLVRHHALQGDTLGRAEHTVTPTPVPAAQRDSGIRRIRRYAGGAPFDEARMPSVFPYFESITTSSDGHLWAYRRTGDGFVFDVFDPDGTFLGVVAPPSGIRPNPYRQPVIRGGDLWLISTDEAGADEVARLKIVQ